MCPGTDQVPAEPFNELISYYGASAGSNRESDGSGMIGFDVMNADVTSVRCLRLGIFLGYEDRCPDRRWPRGFGSSVHRRPRKGGFL